ncbi:Endonuclease MutS2 [Durusdinium trenchii]
MTAAMEYKMGRPTYRLTTNAVGESHAIETAQRLGLPPSIVKRAEELLGDDQRRLLALQRQASAAEQDFIAAKLEADQREAAAQQAILETQSKESDLAHRAQQLTQMEVEVKERMNALKRQTDAELKARVEVKERQFQDVVRRLKMEAQHSGVQLRIVGDALEDLRVQVTAPKASSSDVPAIPGAMGLRDPLNRGDWVVVMADPPWYGLKGQVERIELAKDGGAPCIHVRLGANGKLKEFSKTQLKRTQAPPQAARTLKKPKNEVAAPTRNYSSMMF